MPVKKIACLGAGSLYFPRALGDLACRHELSGSEVTLYDLDAEKAERMAALGRRLAEVAGNRVSVRAVTRLAEAVDGADFALSSIGGSGAEVTPDVYSSYYHSADMHICAKYGLHQVVGDTAGPAGMMMGLRTVPAHIAICREMEKRCPGVILFSHSNPMAVLCAAMRKHTAISVVGICHGVQESVQQIASMLGLPAAELDCVWVGTNHYYWFLRVVHRGVDCTEQLKGVAAGLGVKGSPTLVHRLSRLYGCKVGYPGAGHLIEFYPWATRVPSQEAMPYRLAEEARSHGFDERHPMRPKEEATPEVRARFMEKYQGLLDRTALPDQSRADPMSEEGVARMIAAISAGRREVFIVNIPNGGIVANLPSQAILEVEGVTDSAGLRGVQVGPCPTVLKGMLEKRIAWQELVAEAAVTGDRGLALQAMMLDEMSLDPDRNEDMLEELLGASRDLLPQFFPGQVGPERG